MRPDSQAERAAVISTARSWIGTPFHPGAMVKGAGVDCGTLMVACYAAAGIPVPRELGHFAKDWHMHTREERYLAFMDQYAGRVKTPKPGDIAMFRVGYVYSHSAIVVAWPNVIHAQWNGCVEVADADKHPFPRARGAGVIFYSPWG